MNASESLTLARQGKIQQAEQALMAEFDDPDAPVADWPAVIETLVKVTSAEDTEPLAWSTLDAIELRLAPNEALRYCGRILRLFSKNYEFRERAVGLYRQAFPDAASLDRLIELSGLSGGKPVRRALQTLNLCLAIRENGFLVHKDEGPAARVVAVERNTWSVRVETPSGEELFDPVTLGDQYELAELDDYRVLQQFDPQRLADKLRSAPADIVLPIIRSHENEITSDQLETMLSPRFLPRDEWSKWWSRARTSLKKNSHIRLTGRNPVVITYDDAAISLEDEVWAKFNVHASPKAWLDLAQEYLRESKARALKARPDFLIKLRDAVKAHAPTLEGRRDSEALAAWLTVRELSRLGGESVDDTDVGRVLNACTSIKEPFLNLSADVHWPMALECVKTCRPESWPADYAALLPITTPNRCDALVRQIKEADRQDLLVGLVDTILADPVTHANGLCWLYNGPADAGLLEVPPQTTLITRIFGVLDQVSDSTTINATRTPDIRGRIRATFSAGKCKRFRDCLAQIDAGMGHALHTQLHRAEGLTKAVVSDMNSCIRSQFPELWSRPQKQRWEDDEVLYCTERGYGVKEAELKELVNVKLKENAVAIGRAAEHGDLSENSEYKSALEERDLLRARIAEIQNQMSKARVLRRDNVPNDHITVGAKVDFRHAPTDQRITLTFLGPWESNIDQNILNYQAPISLRLMGLKVGEVAEFELKGMQGQFEVLSIDAGIP